MTPKGSSAREARINLSASVRGALDTLADLERDFGEMRRLLVIAYDALFFEAGMSPKDRDDMRQILEKTARFAR